MPDVVFAAYAEPLAGPPHGRAISAGPD